MDVKVLVSVTDDWAIGKDGAMLVRNPADMRRFKEFTTGHPIIMGRRTLESLPGGRPLKDRRNIVLSRSNGLDVEGICVAHGIKGAKELARATGDDEVWIIGGEAVYRSFLPCSDVCYATRNHVSRPDADTWFPNLDDHPYWELVATEKGGVTPDGIPFDYLTYRRIAGCRLDCPE